MSFIEFLLEYYIYILAVLIILIVGVIGFLVDSKNKEKKQKAGNQELVADDKKSEVITANTDVNNGTMMQTNDMNTNVVANNSEQAIQPQEVIASNEQIEIGQAQMMDVQRNQEPLDNLNVNPSMGAILDVNNGMNSMQQTMSSSMTNVVSEAMPVNNAMVNMQNMSNEMNVVQDMQPQMVEVAVNPTPVSNINTEGYTSNVDSNLQNVHPQMVDMAVNPMSVNNVNTEIRTMNTPNMNNGINSLQSVQPQMVNVVENVAPVNNGMNMVNVPNVNSGMNVVQNVQSEVPTQITPVNSMTFNTDNNIANEIVGAQVMQPQMTNMNQPVMNNVNQMGMAPTEMVQNTDVTGQTGNVENLQNNNAVFTTDNAQPFDISSMFANNQ